MPGQTPSEPTPSSTAIVGVALSWSLARYREHLGAYLALAAPVVVVQVVSTVVGRGLTRAAVTDVSGQVATLGVVLALGLGFGVLAALAAVGVYRAGLGRTIGIVPSFSQLTTGEHLVPYLVVGVIYGVAMSVGLALCFLPGVLVILVLQFSPLFALDQGYGLGRAFGTSMAMLRDNLGTVIIVGLVNVVAAILGGLLFFGILGLVTLPVSVLFTAYIYRSLRGEPIAS